MKFLVCVLGCCLACVAAHAAPLPVILDTDIGDDIDDTWALAMLLGSPELDVKLIVTASDNTPEKTRLLAKYLEAVGRTDIPIGTGKQTSEQPINQAAWLGGYDLGAYPGVVHADGIQAAIEVIHAEQGTVTLIAIGPMTNLKALLERDPSVAQEARLVSMAGSIDIGYEGADKPAPEWNVVKDTAAAQAVFAAPWEITLAPLDTCGTLRLEGTRYQRIAASLQPRASALIANYEQWSNRKHHPADASSILFDTVAIGLALEEKTLKVESIALRVDDEGYTRRDPAKGRPVRCAMAWLDREAFEESLVMRVAEKPAR